MLRAVGTNGAKDPIRKLRGASVVDRLVGRGPEIEIETRRAGRSPQALGHQDRPAVYLKKNETPATPVLTSNPRLGLAVFPLETCTMR